jgi:cation/acetate symporter
VLVHQPGVRAALGLEGPGALWWDVQPIAAGVFGVPVGFAVAIAASLLTPPPSRAAGALVDRLRAPG